MRSYRLMHEDVIVGSFVLSEGAVTYAELIDSAKSHFPLGYSYNIAGLIKWLFERGIPETRRNIASDLHGESVFYYMFDNLGLSLTDHYWLSPYRSELTWGSVNFYENDFSYSYSFDLKEDKGYSPSATLRGNLPKKWVVNDCGERAMLKGNRSKRSIQSLVEVFVSELHRRQGRFPFASYDIVKVVSKDGVSLCCSCPNFTDSDTEFIPAIDICNMSDYFSEFRKPNSMNWFQYYVKFCLDHGLDVQPFMDYMIMTDFIVSNTDRHLNNFGILRNSYSLEFVSPAPIFDSGNSMFYKFDRVPKGTGLLELGVSSFRSREVRMLEFVKDRSLVDVNRLPDDSFLVDLLKMDTCLEPDFISEIAHAYRKKIKYLQDFQNGANIWSYKYKKGR